MVATPCIGRQLLCGVRFPESHSDETGPSRQKGITLPPRQDAVVGFRMLAQVRGEFFDSANTPELDLLTTNGAFWRGAQRQQESDNVHARNRHRQLPMLQQHGECWD